jgi:hypothetical protein
VINLKKIIFLCFLTALLGVGIVFSHTGNVFEEAKQIIDAKIPCSELTEEQFEYIGDYYMEQMHPGEAHEVMDERMGGEGSESLRQMHINMAKSFYCGESDVMSSGMMDMMMGRGMINSGGVTNMMSSEMIGNWGYGSGYLNFINILYIILLIGLIILVYLWIIKLWKNTKSKSGKK